MSIKTTQKHVVDIYEISNDNINIDVTEGTFFYKCNPTINTNFNVNINWNHIRSTHITLIVRIVPTRFNKIINIKNTSDHQKILCNNDQIEYPGDYSFLVLNCRKIPYYFDYFDLVQFI